MAINNEKLYDLYVNKNWSIRKINRNYDISRPSISKKLREMEVDIKGNLPGQKRRYLKEVDETFFQIETKEKYYVLGFFFADGSFIDNGIKFDQTIADREILDKIKKTMKAETEVKIHDRTEVNINGQLHDANPMCRLSLSRMSFREELLELGFALEKTHQASNLNIPFEYTGDFLRGFFDGDGSITNKGSLAMSFTIKNKENAKFIKKLLERIDTNPFIYYHSEKDVYTVVIRRKAELLIVRANMYEDANHLYLQRKKDVFDLL